MSQPHLLGEWEETYLEGVVSPEITGIEEMMGYLGEYDFITELFLMFLQDLDFVGGGCGWGWGR